MRLRLLLRNVRSAGWQLIQTRHQAVADHSACHIFRKALTGFVNTMQHTQIIRFAF